MNDPWDVKSVRLSGQYISCMKINGVPLLPPLLSNQCRKEMQYYRLLAKEVENRLAHLKTYDKGCTSSEESLDELGIPECEHSTPQKKVTDVVEVNITTTHAHETLSNLKVTNGIAPPIKANPNTTFCTAPKSPTSLDLPVEIPERDCNDSRAIAMKTETHEDIEEICSEKFQKNYDYDVTSVDFSNSMFHGPSSLSSKSFTGSLNDLHSETKEMTVSTKLVRQNSYTILQPSPQLLAHLQVQSQSTGMDIMSISMSESMSNISSNKKRRSWDLETAKVKWSSMAMELKKKNLLNNTSSSAQKEKATPKTTQKNSHFQTKSQSVDKPGKQNSKNVTKSEPIQKTKKTSPNSLAKSFPSDKTLVKADTLPRNRKEIKKTEDITISTVSQCNDPASKVRELYEKIQKQQLLQMANLIEKQKKEQMLLQKLFDEQQNVLLKQLKTICPESPKEVKQAWGNPQHDNDSGPVSLSQLIHTPTQQSPEQKIVDTTRSSLQDTNKYIDHCDRVLKKSKDLSSSIKKKTQPNLVNRNGNPPSPKLLSDGSITRPITPVSDRRSTPASRKLNYETSASYDQDYDPMFTDRTNDTFADLNVTFPSDSDDCHQNTTVINRGNDEQSATSVGSALKNMQDTIQRSQKDMNQRKSFSFRNSPTAKELWAASRITAHARGFLVRRLLRTERVQSTVQTIKDALLCALQLHQDRDGIRGADVDLHRRLIQQITAACYCLHDTFVVSSPAERCAMIAADRAKKRASAAKLPPPTTRHYRPT